jgi:hypothetical protein
MGCGPGRRVEWREEFVEWFRSARPRACGYGGLARGLGVSCAVSGAWCIALVIGVCRLGPETCLSGARVIVSLWCTGELLCLHRRLVLSAE